MEKIELCGGESCKIRETCKRYKRFLRWYNAKRFREVKFVEYPKYMTANNNCENYIKV
jgi:hypothetical protein